MSTRTREMRRLAAVRLPCRAHERRLLWGVLLCLCLSAGSSSEAVEAKEEVDPGTLEDFLTDLEREDAAEEEREPDQEAEGAGPVLLRPDPGIEEIVVTAQGREQSIQEISVSVAAFDAAYLEALGAENLTDISQFTPNLEIRSVFAASNPTLFIRGVGLRDFNANSASSVAVYNDEVYMNSPAGQLAQLFDVQQIEILRGPQGTLYGRNASAGAIRVITRKPTGLEEGYGRVTYGRFNQIEIEGAAETSLVPDLLSLRVAGTMTRRDGTTTNRCADDKFWRGYSAADPQSFQSRVFAQCFNTTSVAPPPNGQGWIADTDFPGRPASFPLIRDALDAVVPTDIDKKVNNKDHWAARGLLRLQPTLDQDWLLNVHGGQNRSQARQFQTIGHQEDQFTGALTPPRSDFSVYLDPDTVLGIDPTMFPPAILAVFPHQGDAFQGDYNRTGPEKLDLLGSNLVGEIDFGNLKVRTVTAFEWNDRAVFANVDANPAVSLELDLANTAWQITQELRGFWTVGESVELQAGAFFLYENLEVDNKFRWSLMDASYQSYRQDTYSGSTYGHFTWGLGEYLTLEGGLRWNIDHKTFDLSTGRGPGGPGGKPLPQLLSFGDTTVTEHAPTGDISLTYRPVEGFNVYAKYSRGWKGPHINGGVTALGASVPGQSLIDPVDPENVNALEIGTKALFFDNRVRLAAAAFYYDYEDIQIFQLKNAQGGIPVQELINANDADVYGIEFELETRLFEGWAPELLEGFLLFTSFAWLESSYTDFVNTKVNLIGGNPVPFTEDLSGNTLINAPKYAFTGYTQWDIPLWDAGTLGARFDWSFKDKVFFSPQNFDEVSQDALWLLDARLSYTTPNQAITVAGWVRNITDEVYYADVINIAAFRWKVIYAVGDPRTYGVSVSFQF